MLDTFSSVCLVLVPFQPNFLRPPLKSCLVKSIKLKNFMFLRSQLVTSPRISGGCLHMTPLSLMECLCSAPRTCHKSQLISPHKCHSSLICPIKPSCRQPLCIVHRDYITGCPYRLCSRNGAVTYRCVLGLLKSPKASLLLGKKHKNYIWVKS